MTVNILIYEDNPDFRDALVQLINQTPEHHCLGAFVNCSNVLDELETYQPDVILMDIDMPGAGGIEGVRLIRTKNTHVKIVMLTVFETNQHVLDAICAGASGYILKPHVFKKLFDAIAEVLAGGAPMSASVANMVIDYVRSRSTTQQNSFQLSAKEKEILGHLVKGSSFKMIAGDAGISIETVKTHIKNIYEKLQVHSKSEAVVKALRGRLFE
jgi:DNA-binding NarL/FixJ family response regulator